MLHNIVGMRAGGRDEDGVLSSNAAARCTPPRRARYRKRRHPHTRARHASPCFARAGTRDKIEESIAAGYIVERYSIRADIRVEKRRECAGISYTPARHGLVVAAVVFITSPARHVAAVTLYIWKQIHRNACCRCEKAATASHAYPPAQRRHARSARSIKMPPTNTLLAKAEMAYVTNNTSSPARQRCRHAAEHYANAVSALFVAMLPRAACHHHYRPLHNVKMPPTINVFCRPPVLMSRHAYQQHTSRPCGKCWRSVWS